MKIKDLPDEVATICEKYPDSLGARLLLISLTKRLCPEFKTKKDIQDFLNDVPELVKEPIVQSNAQFIGRRARRNGGTNNNNGPMIEVEISNKRMQYGSASYTEWERGGGSYSVPASIVVEGEDAIIAWLDDNESIWDDADYDDYENGDKDCDGYENEEVTIENSIDDLIEEAQNLLDEANA